MPPSQAMGLRYFPEPDPALARSRPNSSGVNWNM
jgi:hypothetical protein